MRAKYTIDRLRRTLKLFKKLIAAFIKVYKHPQLTNKI